jgi:hypothetical protein
MRIRQPLKSSPQRSLIMTVIALLVLSVGILASSNGCQSSSSSSSHSTSSPVHSASPAGVVATSASTTSAAQTVTFSCSGSAPDGVDITYGPSGSNYSASSVPFSKTMTLDSNAEYYSTQAQLQGSGDVTCKTVISYADSSGNPQTATASAVAQGGYNIATAEECPNFSGGWESCS